MLYIHKFINKAALRLSKKIMEEHWFYVNYYNIKQNVVLYQLVTHT